jgi:glycosyltransferase involved in cell wall biosynthesis
MREGDQHLVEIVIGIPTFRRPRMLRALLRSLEGEVAGRNVLVIVADNECGTDAPQAVEEFARTMCAACCIAVQEHGLASVRNALVDAASKQAPQWRWLVMLDDDGEVLPGWLGPLLAAGIRFDAHVVAGPVLGPLPPGAGRLARNSVLAGRRRWPTGPVPMLNGAQNICISSGLADLMPPPWFGPEFGLSGGEDYDFFRRIKQVGGRLVWCDEAAVSEPPPPDALTTRGLLYRYASTGAYNALIDRHFDGLPAARRTALRGLAATLVRTAWCTVRWDRDGIARGVLDCAYNCGCIAGLVGVRTQRYARQAARANEIVDEGLS